MKSVSGLYIIRLYKTERGRRRKLSKLRLNPKLHYVGLPRLIVDLLGNKNPIRYQDHRSKVRATWVFLSFCVHDTA